MVHYKKIESSKVNMIQNIDEYYSFHIQRYQRACREESMYGIFNSDILLWIVVFDHRLFWNWCIRLLLVWEKFRKKWYASKMIEYCEKLCTSKRLFISTQQENKGMIHLLDKINYEQCWTISYINEEWWDEIFFSTVV